MCLVCLFDLRVLSMSVMVVLNLMDSIELCDLVPEMSSRAATH